MATVRNAKPVSRGKAQEVIYKAQEMGVTTSGNVLDKWNSMHPLDYDMWQNSTPRIGVRHHRLRVWIPDIKFNPQPLKPEQLALFDKVCEAITKVAQEMLIPDNYRIIKHYETPTLRPAISLIVYYTSHS